MSDIINIKKHKNEKINKLVLQDLANSVNIINNSLSDLFKYRQYIPVMECISSLQNSKTLLEIHINKIKRQNKKTE
jgi:uncharacterized membrane-anchored protein YitT (DUF2179 family)